MKPVEVCFSPGIIFAANLYLFALSVIIAKLLPFVILKPVFFINLICAEASNKHCCYHFNLFIYLFIYYFRHRNSQSTIQRLMAAGAGIRVKKIPEVT